jgi:hypothetical protein
MNYIHPSPEEIWLSFNDISANGYHIKTINEGKKSNIFILFHVFQAKNLYLKNYLLSVLEFIIRSWNLLKQILWYTRSVLN